MGAAVNGTMFPAELSAHLATIVPSVLLLAPVAVLGEVPDGAIVAFELARQLGVKAGYVQAGRIRGYEPEAGERVVVIGDVVPAAGVVMVGKIAIPIDHGGGD